MNIYTSRRTHIICSFIFFSIFRKALACPVIINELMPNNQTGITDVTGEHTDWIELYNPNEDPINLQGYSITDKTNATDAFTFPTVYIEGKSHLLLFASNKSITPEGEIHLNFKLDKDGETITLRDPSSSIISKVTYTYIPTDCSWARLEDNGSEFVINKQSSPNSNNTKPVKITCSHPSGFYSETFNLKLTSSTSCDIYYTTNGEEPTIHSNKYKAPLLIKNKNETDYSISNIPTTAMDKNISKNKRWKVPKSVYQCNTIRFAAFQEGVQQTSTQTLSYFVDPNINSHYSIPIFSIAINPHDLFDYTDGIYIAGKVYDNSSYDGKEAIPGNYHNQSKASEKKIHIAYFNPNGEQIFNSDAGMRIRGWGSCELPQKSMNIYFRNEYGTKTITYPLFENNEVTTFKRLVLRNGGQDFKKAHMRDPLLQEIIKDLDLELQDCKPSIVFINGEYWGIHNLREKLNKHYFKYKFDIDEENLNLLTAKGEIITGDNKDYVELLEFVSTNEMKLNENYEQVCKKIDINNFIDYNIAEIYFANYDWPCNNYKIWKTNSPDSKWRFLIYDLDLSYGNKDRSSYETESIKHAITVEDNWPYCECSNRLFRKLLRNEAFVNKFLNRFSECIRTTFDPERVNTIIDKFETSYLPEINEHILRWGYPKNQNEWENNIKELRTFTNKRPFYMEKEIITLFYGENSILKLETKDLISLFPNPSNGIIHLINQGISDIENGELQIINSQGQIVFKQNNLNLIMNEQYQINIGDILESGLYTLVIYNKHDPITHKIVIQ